MPSRTRYPLVPGHLNWRSNDLPTYETYINPKATGLVVAHGKVLNLTDGTAIKGPAGDGTFNRPSWTPSDSAGDPPRSLWTVADGTVLRVVNTAQNTWIATQVDASALASYRTITDLRLSRDGVRVAIVAGGSLLVGAVVADPGGGASIRQVRLLQPSLTSVTRVDWLNQSELVVATIESGAPVQTVSEDGRTLDPFTSANLYSAVTDVAALDNQP